MNRLGLRRRDVLEFLNDMRRSLSTVGGRDISVIFVDTLRAGDGESRNYDKDVSDLMIGIGALSGKTTFLFSRVDDLTFTRTVVALFHEYGHYLQNYGPNQNLQEAVSEISAFYNPSYYLRGWKEFPHEISAEATGVMLGWNAIESVFPDKADACMLEYVNFRADNTSYMLPHKDDGYQSRDEVRQAFESAMEKSLNEPRQPQSRFLQYDDEASRLLMQGCKSRFVTPNKYHVDKLIGTMPGEQKDRMMASLVLHLHPDLLDERPILWTTDLSIEHVFGKPLVVETLFDSHVKDSEHMPRSVSFSCFSDEGDDDYDF